MTENSTLYFVDNLPYLLKLALCEGIQVATKTEEKPPPKKK